MGLSENDEVVVWTGIYKISSESTINFSSIITCYLVFNPSFLQWDFYGYIKCKIF